MISKVRDSHNMLYLPHLGTARHRIHNQGVVYGTMTDETALDDTLINRFDYDEVFGTVLNRFCVQAAVGYPLTVYGKGGPLSNTRPLRRVGLPEPSGQGEIRVFNQFTEQFWCWNSAPHGAGFVAQGRDPAPAGPTDVEADGLRRPSNWPTSACSRTCSPNRCSIR